MKIKSIAIATLCALPLFSTAMLTSCAIKQKQETVGQYVDAGVITSEVKSKIIADKTLRNTSISVKTYQNVVQLSGIVHSAKQKARAEMIARSVQNVSVVDNDLKIK